jgi:arylsulfatase A-like enzyme
MRHGLQVGVVRPWAQYGLPLEERTLAQGLKEAGYTTAICGKWHLGHFQRAYLPTQRGFDHQYGHYCFVTAKMSGWKSQANRSCCVAQGGVPCRSCTWCG